VLDRTALIALIQLPELYQGCTHFETLQPLVAALRPVPVKSKCGSCSVEEQWIPVLDVFWEQLNTADTDVLEHIRAVIADKKGYLPKPIAIYYRRAGVSIQPHPFRKEF
jgi:hypothetical protein